MLNNWSFERFELDAQCFELRRDGVRVAVQPKVLKLLIYLVAQRARAPSVTELLAEIWPDETVTEASLRRAIRGVRRALGDSGDSQAYVRTVRGRGYQFAVEVDSSDAEEVVAGPGSLRPTLSEHHLKELSWLAVSGLPSLRPRRALSQELVRFAPQQGEPLMLVRGCLAQIQDGLELGRLAEVDGALVSLERLAAREQEPLLHWYVQLFRTMRATVDGHFAEAEQLARGALQIGACAGAAAQHAYAIQTLWILMQQGRFEVAEQLVTEVCARNPTLSAWRVALACIETFQGRARDTRRDLEAVFAAERAADAADPFPVSGFAPATELCVMTHDAESARVLYHVLAPLAEEHAPVSVGLATHGPLGRQLGMLAGCFGDFAAARVHFETALRQSVQMPSPPLTAMAAYEYARVLAAERAQGGCVDPRLETGLLSWASAIAAALGMLHVAKSCAALRAQAPGPRESGTSG